MSLSLVEMFAHMGFVAWFVVICLVVCSLYSLAVMIDRFMTYRAARKQSLEFLPALVKCLKDNQLEQAVETSRKYKKSHIAKVVSAGLMEVLNQGDTTFFGLDSFPQVVLIGAQIKTGQLSASEYFDYGYKPLPFYIRGDLNEDLAVNSQDIVYQINFLFLGILPPENRLEAAELNCDGRLSAADLVLLLHLVFLFLPPPC